MNSGKSKKWLGAREKENFTHNREINKLTAPIQIGKKRHWQLQDEDFDVDDDNEANKRRRWQIVCVKWW